MAYVCDHTTWEVETRAKEVKPKPNKCCIVHLPLPYLLETPNILLKGDITSCLIGLENCTVSCLTH